MLQIAQGVRQPRTMQPCHPAAAAAPARVDLGERGRLVAIVVEGVRRGVDGFEAVEDLITDDGMAMGW